MSVSENGDQNKIESKNWKYYVTLSLCYTLLLIFINVTKTEGKQEERTQRSYMCWNGNK